MPFKEGIVGAAVKVCGVSKGKVEQDIDTHSKDIHKSTLTRKILALVGIKSQS